jgi:hypothetical protein
VRSKENMSLGVVKIHVCVLFSFHKTKNLQTIQTQNTPKNTKTVFTVDFFKAEKKKKKTPSKCVIKYSNDIF